MWGRFGTGNQFCKYVLKPHSFISGDTAQLRAPLLQLATSVSLVVTPSHSGVYIYTLKPAELDTPHCQFSFRHCAPFGLLFIQTGISGTLMAVNFLSFFHFSCSFPYIGSTVGLTLFTMYSPDWGLLYYPSQSQTISYIAIVLPIFHLFWSPHYYTSPQLLVTISFTLVLSHIIIIHFL